MNILVIPILCSIVLLGIGITGASAIVDTTHTESVCLYSPIDLFIDPNLLQVVGNEIDKFNVTVKTVSIFDQITKDNSSCGIIVKIDRSLNENYGYTNHATRYTISGNVLTVFTYKYAGNYHSQAPDSRKAMNNPVCLGEALAVRYHNIGEPNYQNLSCNPYISSKASGEIPVPIIQKAVDAGMEQLLK